MRELEQRAYSFLGRRAILCMDMVEALRRGLASVSAVREDGALIYVRATGTYMLAGNIQAEEAMDLLRSRPVQLAVHDRKSAEMLRDKLGYEGMMECHAAAYIEPFPPRPGRFDIRAIRQLEPRHEDAVLEAFPEDFDPYDLRERLAAGALHGVADAAGMLGVIGLYPEGGIGMLYLRPDAPEDAALGLAAYVTGWCLENCLAPFVHIPTGDQALREIYERLGYTFSKEEMYWLG